MSENAKLTRGSIRGHLVGQTLPAIIGVAAIMSIGLVDSYFIGKLGSGQLAAVAFIFPISVVITSLGVGLMVGINSVVARALGEGEDGSALRRANLGLVLSIMVGITLTGLAYIIIDPLFRLMQAPEDLMPYIREYMFSFAPGIALMMIIMGINGMLRGQGEARRTSYVSISYSVANWVLDPILITGAFGFEGYGISGAAYASVLGWAIGVGVGLLMLSRTFLTLNLAVVKEAHLGPCVKQILRVAGPAALANSINPIGLSILTALLASQGSEAVAGFGAAGRVQGFATVPLLALSGSIGAIVGQNWGANLPDRSRKAMLYAGIFAVIYGLVTALILAANGEWFAGFFTEDPAVISEFATYLAIAAWGYAGFGLLITANGALNAVDHSRFALMQSAVRVFLVMLPAAWLLRDVWGPDAIYAAELAANIVGGALAAIIVWRILKRNPKAV
jgi:putative MATE family efflux protein